MVWEDNIDLGEGIIPIHILNLICAVHLQQEHGFKRWQISRFNEGVRDARCASAQGVVVSTIHGDLLW